MTDDDRPAATPSQTVGPFFHFGLTTDEAAGRYGIRPGTGGGMRLRVIVLDGQGVPVPDALIELYQADADGTYSRPGVDQPPAGAGFTGFRRLPTDEHGCCVFETVRPGAVATAAGGALAPHIVVCLLARGLLRPLFTRLYFAGDAGLDDDPILALVPADRRQTLLATRSSDSESDWEFVIRLQGDRETVFFDL
jgi:protocatechuate 3,4-dioxygenase, alpha subunit